MALVSMGSACFTCAGLLIKGGDAARVAAAAATGVGFLGAGDVDLIAVREGGGWLVSPIATIADAASIAVDSFIPYYESGALDELFR